MIEYKNKYKISNNYYTAEINIMLIIIMIMIMIMIDYNSNNIAAMINPARVNIIPRLKGLVFGLYIQKEEMAKNAKSTQ